MSDLLVGKTDYPPGNAGIAPAHEEARGMTPQQRSGALRLPGGDRVVDGAIDVAVLLEPCAGAGRQTSDRIGFAHLELRAKNITHEPVAAIPLAVGVERQQREILKGEGLQQPSRAGVLQHSVAKRRGELVEDRATPQKLARLL